ncbi:MAG: tetratricopeptide repeat protein [Saprospiraceae bacterium]
MRIVWTGCLILWIYQSAICQVPFSGDIKENTVKEGMYFFDHQLYGVAADLFKKYYTTPKLPTESNYVKLENEAFFWQQISELYLELPQAPNRLRYAIDKHLPDPITIPAVLNLGRYHYNKRAYKNCVEIYEKVDFDLIPFIDQVEHRFNKGYCHFVMKEFKEAKYEFESIKKDMGVYYFHTYYYLGLSEYFLKNVDKAVQYFKIAEQNSVYKPYIPYYICQIHFNRGDWDEVITYGEQSLKALNLKNKNNIGLLVGQAYFNNQDFENALPYFEDYSGQTEQLSVEEFYQIGFTFYKNKLYNEAIPSFKAIHLEQNEFGQLANYYLADCYLKTGDNHGARIAFKNVSQMTFIPAMQDEAAFNYAKLTAESGIEREAIGALDNISESSTFYQESREVLSDVLSNSSDLYFAIEVLEKQKKLTQKMKATYQRLQVQAGHKAYADANWSVAENHYNKSLTYLEEKVHEAEAQFWKAQIKQNQEQYDASISLFEKYFQAVSKQSMPLESSPLLAHYAQGFNYLKKSNYKKAQEQYQNSYTYFQQNKLTSSPWKNIASDACSRAGDCAFKDKEYHKAVANYQIIINNSWNEADYAMFQKGIILGLQNEPYEKIIVLKEVVTKFPKSLYADQAYMQIGDTYHGLNNPDNAYKAYQDLLKTHKNTSLLANEARIKSGLIAYNKGDLNTAIKQYKEVLESNPTATEIQSALTGLEEIYINDLGKPDDYVSILESIPGIKPSAFSSDSLHYKVGEVRYFNGDYAKAIDAFNTYLQKFPKGYYHVQATYHRAESRAVLNEYNEALQDYSKVISFGQTSFMESSLKKAALISFHHTSNFDNAFTYYDQYYKTTKSVVEKFWGASGALKSAFKSNKLSSVLEYGQIVSEDPQANIDDKASASYYMGKISYTEKNFEQALSYFNKIGPEINSSQAAESRFWIGDILIKLSKWDEAEKHCNAANELNKFYPYWIARSVLLLSDIYLHNGDLYSARAAIEAVLENFGDDAGLVKLANERKEHLEKKEVEISKIKPKSKNQLHLDERENP